MLIEYWGAVLQKRVSLRQRPRQLWDLASGLLLYLVTTLLPWLFALPVMLPWSWLPDPLLKRFKPLAYRDKYSEENIMGFHGADGRVDEDAFDIFFALADRNNVLALTGQQLASFTHDQRDPANFFSGALASFESVVVKLLLQGRNGRVRKSDLRDFYYGLSFRRIVHSRASALLPR